MRKERRAGGHASNALQFAKMSKDGRNAQRSSLGQTCFARGFVQGRSKFLHCTTTWLRQRDAYFDEIKEFNRMHYMAAEIEYEQQNQITLNGQEKIVIRSYEIDVP
jgi:hypothetical protein